MVENKSTPSLSLFYEKQKVAEDEALKTLARALKTASSNIYSLITVIGKDATGAFTFASEENAPVTSFRKVTTEELTERIRNRATKPISIWDGKPRLSLARVQEKIALTLKDGEYGFGEGELASTHILKFSKKDQHLVLNEYFCMKLAEKISLPVARVELLLFEERVLQVERFDRNWRGANHVVRKHVIDGCQALNVPPEFKYQRIISTGPEKDHYLGPISVENLSRFNKSCVVPAKAQLQLLEWILFNLLIGNTDNHGKNISYFVTSKGYEITPAYDLVNVAVYEEFHHELAFKIGDTFSLNEVKAFQLAEMTQQMGLQSRFVASRLKKIGEAVLKQLNEMVIDDLSREEDLFVKKINTDIRIRTESFLKQAGLIDSVSKSL